MKIAHQSESPRIPRIAVAFSAALMILSIAAVVLQATGDCGSCAVRNGPWYLIAPLGALGYAALTVAGLLRSCRVFSTGSAMAAAMHTVLVAAMVLQERFCALCAIAAALAIAMLLIVLGQEERPGTLLLRIYLPVLLVAAGPTGWALSNERALATDRQAFARAIHRTDPVAIQVFEQDQCGYCRDFRAFYLPQLDREFRDQVRVLFLPATAASWVRRTPTIVIEGGPIFEGLPVNYAELRSAVAGALDSRK